MFSNVLQLEMPQSFPLAEYEAFVNAVRRVTDAYSDARKEFNGASNLIGWRFRPPLATQQAIVAEIEAEQALVAANRELIARFEKKIQATLARVWGEDEPVPAEA